MGTGIIQGPSLEGSSSRKRGGDLPINRLGSDVPISYWESLRYRGLSRIL
jgi:hypothetical protein